MTLNATVEIVPLLLQVTDGRDCFAALVLPNGRMTVLAVENGCDNLAEPENITTGLPHYRKARKEQTRQTVVYS